jgi:erythromycin esterase-like protein
MSGLGTTAEVLPDIDDPAFVAVFDRFADARIVLLGESSHGTSEFYTARAAITRRLVERHGFTIVGLEARWAEAKGMDDYVRHRPWCNDAAPVYQQFPAWMWCNEETDSFLRWLRD